MKRTFWVATRSLETQLRRFLRIRSQAAARPSETQLSRSQRILKPSNPPSNRSSSKIFFSDLVQTTVVVSSRFCLCTVLYLCSPRTQDEDLGCCCWGDCLPQSVAGGPFHFWCYLTGLLILRSSLSVPRGLARRNKIKYCEMAHQISQSLNVNKPKNQNSEGLVRPTARRIAVALSMHRYSV